MIYKQTIGNELYVYMNGSLLYKRWMWLGHGKIFDKWGVPWSASDVESMKKHIENVKLSL